MDWDPAAELPTAVQLPGAQLISDRTRDPGTLAELGDSRQVEPPTQSAIRTAALVPGPWLPTAVQPTPLEQLTPRSVLGDWAPPGSWTAMKVVPFHHCP